MIDRLVAIKLNDMREELPGFEWNPVVEKEFAFDKQIELVVVRILTTIPRLENYGEGIYSSVHARCGIDEVDGILSDSTYRQVEDNFERTHCSGY